MEFTEVLSSTAVTFVDEIAGLIFIDISRFLKQCGHTICGERTILTQTTDSSGLIFAQNIFWALAITVVKTHNDYYIFNLIEVEL